MVKHTHLGVGHTHLGVGHTHLGMGASQGSTSEEEVRPQNEWLIMLCDSMIIAINCSLSQYFHVWIKLTKILVRTLHYVVHMLPST